MYLKNKRIPKNITCYVTDEKLAIFIQTKKNIPLFMKVDKKYYFVKNSFSQNIFEGEIPLFYRWFSEILEQKGGEEN